MFKLATLTATLAVGFAASAFAATSMPLPSGVSQDSRIIQVGEGCGPGRWRAPNGVCRFFANGYGSYRGTSIECPPYWHIGPGRQRCWPNR